MTIEAEQLTMCYVFRIKSGQWITSMILKLTYYRLVEDGNRSSFRNVVFSRIPDDGKSPKTQ
jgi:hypothetical protein